MDAKYLSALRKRITGQVPSDIRTLILHLFRIYGKITPQQLRTRYENVEKMEYSIDESIAIIFDAVEDLVETGELAGKPYSPLQIVDLRYMVLVKNRIFRGDIRKWGRRSEVEITWANFKLTFIDSHQELRDTDASVDGLDFHSANTIVEQLRTDIPNGVSQPIQQPPNETNENHIPAQPTQ